MKEFFSRVSPRKAISDLLEVWGAPQRHRWPVLGLAMAITFALLMLFLPDSARVPPEPPEVIWIATFEEGRTPAQIIASNCRNQELKDQMEDLLAQRAELRRDIYKALGRATFIDVDQIEAEAEAERAREEAAADARGENTPPPNDPAAGMSVEEYCAPYLG